jgi:hypothetical protein
MVDGWVSVKMWPTSWCSKSWPTILIRLFITLIFARHVIPMHEISALIHWIPIPPRSSAFSCIGSWGGIITSLLWWQWTQQTRPSCYCRSIRAHGMHLLDGSPRRWAMLLCLHCQSCWRSPVKGMQVGQSP